MKSILILLLILSGCVIVVRETAKPNEYKSKLNKGMYYDGLSTDRGFFYQFEDFRKLTLIPDSILIQDTTCKEHWLMRPKSICDTLKNDII